MEKEQIITVLEKGPNGAFFSLNGKTRGLEIVKDKNSSCIYNSGHVIAVGDIMDGKFNIYGMRDIPSDIAIKNAGNKEGFISILSVGINNYICFNTRNIKNLDIDNHIIEIRIKDKVIVCDIVGNISEDDFTKCEVGVIKNKTPYKVMGNEIIFNDCDFMSFIKIPDYSYEKRSFLSKCGKTELF